MLLSQKPVRGMQINKTHPLAKGLVSAWIMNEATGETVFDLSGNGNNGTIIGAGWVPDGLDFVAANADYMDILDSVTGGHVFTGLSDNISIISGINPDAVANAASPVAWFPNHVITELRTQTTSGTHVPFSFGINSNKLLLGVTDNYTTGFENAVGNTTLSINTNYDVAFTINGDDWNLFLNGAGDGSGTFSVATGDRSVGDIICNMQIGVRSRDAGQKDAHPFGGGIKYLYIYNRALSPYEISWLNRKPYAMFQQPINPALFYYEAPTGFNPAWARNINNLLQDGITNV